MFDPSDFSYKELSDTLRDHYDPDDILLTNIIEASDPPSNSKSLAEVTEQMISSVENQLSIHSNESGRFFNIDSTFLDSATNNIENNEGIFIVQPPDNLFNYEPTLLDDNTVNQFLLPLQSSSENNKDLCIGPDLLALHSCVICHEIFTMEADLLDHTISHHASTSIQQSENAVTPLNYNKDTALKERSSNFENLDFEGEWLICSICKRVLATALEVEPSEQLCCIDGSGKSSVSTRKLHTMFVCEGCSGLFADGEALDRHRIICFIQDSKNYEYSEEMAQDESNSNAKVYQESAVCFSCDTCGKQYGTADQLKAHAMDCQRPVQRKNERRPYNSSNSNKMWNCGSCNQLFATARELYRHKRGEDRPTGAPLMAYVCEECDKVLGSMCALHTHKKMHKNSKPGYPCRVCGRRFNQSGHLAIHMRMHTGERPYPCDLCPKAFKVKVERDDHRRTHTGERPFACAACPKTFTAAARLREHARIHTDQRPYRCDICGAAFRRPYARTVHTLIHTGEKPHECDVCGTAFRRSGDMWKHKRTLHGIQAGNLDS